MPPMHEAEASPGSDEDREVSSEASLDEISAGSAPADVAEGSSPSDEKDEPKSLLDVVKNAVEPKTEAPEDSSASDPEKPEADKDGGEEENLSDEDLAKLPFGRHPRFKRLLTERNEYRQKTQEFETRVQELEPAAQQYERIDTFLKTARIEADEFVRLMKVGALIKNNPDEARKEVLQVLFELDQTTGNVLPDDLRKDVEEGRIAEDRARELSQARAREARATERAREAETARENVERSTTSERALQAIGTAVADWEARTQANDPDFAAKEQLIADRVIALNAQHGLPKSPAEAVQRTQDAYDFVTKHLRGMMPAKPEIKRSPESASTSNAVPVPKNLRDVVDIALRTGT